MRTIRHPGLLILSLALLFVPGCAGDSNPLPLSPLNLNPYLTVTRSVAASPTSEATSIPIPTSTPSIYTVARGDTLSSIAEHFGIPLQDLLAANPGVVPEALSVGQTLKIPVVSPGSGGGSASTPAPLDLGAAQCYPSGSGLYCLALLHNPFPEALENVKLQITLLDGNGQTLANQEAFPPLDILPPGHSLPAYAFFPLVAPGSQPVARVVNAIRLAPGDARYLPAQVRNTLVSVDWNGRSAQAQGEIFLPAESAPAGLVWLAAVAYDVNGQAVGFRRWEGQGSLQPGQVEPFILSVYSLGPAIERVDLVVEARP